ncbi:camp-regulated phosphoprotein/endosulfine conserved region-domain-containing protein [Cercophora newfieldiana]|uniref:mRNA stability protein n=1 Tax=Cercophora newfieldiana TaxID=92897 RepID=A0AA39Y1Z8_9PEZI|nr:camp-regulated phosphoprotein/endosulfine conserved region-domain-containing protein [Cercophora newfieldiana]
MNPHQAKKVDIKSLSPEEQRLFRLYGKLPTKSDHFAKHLKERKYFDSGDYAMSKAGKGNSVDTGAVGSQHPVPENIPHLSSPISGTNGFSGLLHPQQHHSNLQAGSPVKESSFLNRETSAEDLEGGAEKQQRQQQEGAPADAPAAAAPPAEGLPIRR